MRKVVLILGAIFVISHFLSCKHQDDKTVTDPDQNSNLEEITPFIETRVMIYDTFQLKNAEKGYLPRTYMEERGVRFLSYAGFNTLVKQLKNTFYDPGSLIYGSYMDDSTLTLKRRREMTHNCDTVEFMNVDNNDRIVKNRSYVCDSTSFWQAINMIMFYESWYYNKINGEIVKKQLGYAIWQWVEEKQAWRERFVNFTSKESRGIVLKYY